MIFCLTRNTIFDWFIIYVDIFWHVIELIELTLKSLPNNEVRKEYLKEKVKWDW